MIVQAAVAAAAAAAPPMPTRSTGECGATGNFSISQLLFTVIFWNLPFEMVIYTNIIFSKIATRLYMPHLAKIKGAIALRLRTVVHRTVHKL